MAFSVMACCTCADVHDVESHKALADCMPKFATEVHAGNTNAPAQHAPFKLSALCAVYERFCRLP